MSRYKKKDVFNACETGLFLSGYQIRLSHTKVIGVKMLNSKHRVTVMFCTNMDGSEKSLGNQRNADCFKNITSMKTWMSGYLFEKSNSTKNEQQKIEKFFFSLTTALHMLRTFRKNTSQSIYNFSH